MAGVGSIIDGKYRIIRKIGEGGMSKVYLAKDMRLGKMWALKEIQRRSKNENGIYEAGALAEANILKKLDHPALPRIVDIIEGRDYLYVVMDYIEGENLGAILEKEKKIQEKNVLEWAADLCSVLKYLHGQSPPIIYRDMKPDNIMLQHSGQIKLIDFGIAREYKNENSRDTVCLGTRGYAAPEQFGGRGQSDQRTDIYCLGVTLYHLITGKNPCEPPFKIYPIRHWDRSLSPGLESIILKCTQANPDDRYQSVDELIHSIKNYEKEDASYKKRQKRKLRIYSATVLMSALFFALGTVCYVRAEGRTQTEYFNLLERCERSTDSAEKCNLIRQAVAMIPKNSEAYFELVEIFKEDGCFDTDEEKLLSQLIDTHIGEIKQSDNYGALAYEIGRLYWYYYSYGDSRITRMKSSVPWFSDAVTYTTGSKEDDCTASIYLIIGCFHRDITVRINEDCDRGIYSQYFQSLCELSQLMENSGSDSEMLDCACLILYSLGSYKEKLISDGISETEINRVWDKAVNIINETRAESERTSAMKEEINRYLDEWEGRK